MENLTNKAIHIALDSSSVKDVESSCVPTSGVESLSYMQKQKYDYLLPLFGDNTAKLVTFIEGRGRNSWTKVNDKITSLDQASNTDAIYHDALFDNFTVGEVYLLGDIPGIVAGVRRDLGLRPYTSRLRSSCENDLFSLFIVQDVTIEVTGEDGKKKPKLIGYKPVFKLKVED